MMPPQWRLLFAPTSTFQQEKQRFNVPTQRSNVRYKRAGNMLGLWSDGAFTERGKFASL
jgi:hypothetical protein